MTEALFEHGVVAYKIRARRTVSTRTATRRDLKPASTSSPRPTWSPADSQQVDWEDGVGGRTDPTCGSTRSCL